VGALALVAVIGWQSLGGPSASRDGGVLGVTASAAPSRAAPTSGTPLATASAASSPPPVAPSPSVVPMPEPAFQLGQPTAVTWQGSLGETRLQVIVPVRNVGSGWIQLPRSTSTYRVTDENGDEVASGVFTAALPSSFGPGEVGYLVDTVSVAFVVPNGAPAVEAEVEAVAVDRPTTDLVLADLAASTGDSGGLRVAGRVRNDGPRAAEWVIAGAILLGGDRRALAAVYDPTDGGRLEPAASLTFDTEYPGAPPPKSAGTSLVGIAFDALDHPPR
jgi:hypothetical protein